VPHITQGVAHANFNGAAASEPRIHRGSWRISQRFRRFNGAAAGLSAGLGYPPDLAVRLELVFVLLHETFGPETRPLWPSLFEGLPSAHFAALLDGEEHRLIIRGEGQRLQLQASTLDLV